ncbi:putative claudin-24 [Myxocyprinus asiaticus]|uniref:putative claudin-24 n=1 Tax=Myxocyprinus asiaticus TaxID=70543 RepID=UPI0022218623|nr:putative claudin-24 [Myxocyprinus asiaticus]
MDPGVCALELLGVFFSLGAWLCSLMTTMMSQWLTLSTELLPTERFELGLWETCVVQELGITECRPYDSLLGLPSDIRLARILMCTTVAIGLIGLLFAIPGIYLVNSCKRTETLEAKRTLKMLGGIFCFVAGILGLVPVSYIAHLTVLRFFDESVPSVVPRWEFGDALFFGWTAGCLHLVAGFLLVTSCIWLQNEECQLIQSMTLNRTQIMNPEHSPRRRTEYV